MVLAMERHFLRCQRRGRQCYRNALPQRLRLSSPRLDLLLHEHDQRCLGLSSAGPLQ